MQTEKKLRALQRTFELEEQRALAARNKIDEVVEQRRAIVEKLHEERRRLSDALHRLRNQDRSKALQAGQGAALASISRYSARIEKELAELSGVIASREQELASAVERLTAAGDDVIAARLEKKRVERLLDKREFSERLRDEANKEADADEMSFYRRRKE